jgi:hypothetical protein
VSDTSLPCICGHTQGQHEGLRRACLSTPCECPSFKPKHDVIDHPPHYASHPSGVECITIVETMCFNVGNAIKYLWRAGLKGDALEDLKKARWYVDREIARRSK